MAEQEKIKKEQDKMKNELEKQQRLEANKQKKAMEEA